MPDALWSLYHEGDPGSIKPALLLASLAISDLIEDAHDSGVLPVLFQLP